MKKDKNVKAALESYAEKQIKDNNINRAKDYMKSRKYYKSSRVLKKIVLGISVTAVIIVIMLSSTAVIYTLSNSIDFDYILGNKVLNRIANAQYLPDASILCNDDVSLSVDSYEYNTTPQLDYEEYKKLIDTLGHIYTDDQAGMENGFSNVNSIKDELYNVISKAPAFDVWFADGEGMQNLFRGKGYYIHFDESNNLINAICVSNTTDTSIIDYEKQKIIENYYSGPRLRQIMDITYYYDELGREVIEIYVYNVMTYKNKTYPIAYQYIKNVKNASFTKVYVLCNIRTRPLQSYIDKVGEHNYSPGGHDVVHTNEYGTIRSMVQIDYSGNEMFNMLMVDQCLPNFYHSYPKSTSIRNYRKINKEILYFSTSYDYSDESNAELGAIAQLDIDRFSRKTLFASLETELYTLYDGRQYVCEKCRSAESGLMEKCDCFVSADSIQRQGYYINLSTDINLVYKNITQTTMKLAENMQIEDNKIRDFSDAVNVNFTMGDFIYETQYDLFIDNLINNFVDNFFLRDGAKEILDSYSKSKIINNKNNVSAISKIIEVNSSENSGEITNGIIDCGIKGSINSSILLNNGGEYSLSLILIDSGYSTVLLSDYKIYSNEKMDFDYIGTYDLKDLIINVSGNYELAVALTNRINGREFIVSECYPISLSYQPFTIEDTVTGYHTCYKVSYKEDKLYIKADVIDVEPPVLTYNHAETYIKFDEEPMAGELFNYFTMYDNELIKSYEILDQYNHKINWLTRIDTGTYHVKITDTSGNYTMSEVRVIVQ